MPRKADITRERVVEAAFELVRREGADALTARALAAELGCSTQPVMYQFPSLSALREAVYQQADTFHTEYILAADSFLGIGLRYIEFAAEEPALFRLLFQSGHFDGASLQELIQAPEAAPLLAAMGVAEGGNSQETDTPEEQPPDSVAFERFEALYVAVHGYASLIANNAMEYDPAAAQRTLVAIGKGLRMVSKSESG